jgi:hypothetical protein
MKFFKKYICVNLELEQCLTEHADALRSRICCSELRLTKHNFFKIFPFCFEKSIVQCRH